MYKLISRLAISISVALTTPYYERIYLHVLSVVTTNKRKRNFSQLHCPLMHSPVTFLYENSSGL
ncbi:uncharacterized protein SPAPADRAFT_60144 [Spathaspora passalidarum NRRL Y-27907]|uniref:Uncharacterized protein n=1 Tax=Spathaspora passalidarum (strain NRRL Y-27907 / 11-Y1) TaxID=619300 RepID=G3AME6_SPAPN|nr:uncharacterized protein SPAPADRAFT_60144 [Spathaspora passalidarum NRRL Y-27907]EGW32798.1 hypothetical protein SPAPADRAFT_60144 [Spathaspora passalidarum NRRL Y-27907]